MKKFLILACMLFAAAFSFAQNAKSAGVTDSDVKSWAKNLNSIKTEFEDAGLDSEDASSISAKQKAQAEKILQKYGIAGPGSVEKYAMITQCATVVYAESQMDAQSIAMMKAMGLDPLAALKTNINEKDYKVVSANSKAVIAAMDGYEDNTSVAAEEDDDEFDTGDLAVQQYKKYYQPQIDEMNEDTKYIRDLYEKLSKAKGDCGILYKDSDKQHASGYKKAESKNRTIFIYSGDSLESIDENDKYSDGCRAGMEGKIDPRKKDFTLDFAWIEASLDEDEIRSMNGAFAAIAKKKITKSLKFKLKSFEYYELAANYKDYSHGTGVEYIITTNEGLVIHLWGLSSFDGNAYESKTGIKGLDDVDISWYAEND